MESLGEIGWRERCGDCHVVDEGRASEWRRKESMLPIERRRVGRPDGRADGRT